MNTSRGIQGGTVLVLLTCLLFALGPIAVDLSLPALPAIQQSIGTGTQRVELTLTAVLLGMTVGQFLVGGPGLPAGRLSRGPIERQRHVRVTDQAYAVPLNVEA